VSEAPVLVVRPRPFYQQAVQTSVVMPCGVSAADSHTTLSWIKVNILSLYSNHRLNGGSSPVLTATFLSYGESKNSTSHKIKTPDLIEIKFGTVDYVGEGTRRAKFYANSSKGASRQMGETCAKIFPYICLFSSTHSQVRPLKRFLRLIRQTTRFCTRKCLFGIRKLKFNI